MVQVVAMFSYRNKFLGLVLKESNPNVNKISNGWKGEV